MHFRSELSVVRLDFRPIRFRSDYGLIERGLAGTSAATQATAGENGPRTCGTHQWCGNLAQATSLPHRARDSGTVFGAKRLVILKLSRNSRSPAPTADLFDYLWAVNWSVKRYNTFATVDSGLAHVVDNASCRETLDPLPVQDLVFVGNLATGMLPLW